MIDRPPRFQSPIAGLLEEFLAERVAFGFAEKTDFLALSHLDRLWRQSPDASPEMTQECYKRLMAVNRRQQPLSGSTLACRAASWRNLALFLRRRGMDVYIPGRNALPIRPGCYLPFIYTMPQLSALFTAADDAPERKRQYRFHYRYWSPGLFFRMMYGTGARTGEVLSLCRRDFNPETGLLSVYGQKNRRTRLLPLSPSLATRLGEYLRQNQGPPEQPLFASVRTGRAMHDVGKLFRNLLARAGLPLRVNGHGPRMHDLRHTFAVHNMWRWIQAGENLEAKIPVLAAYMGHNKPSSTYYYLRLIEPMLPDLTRRFGAYAAGVIPEGGDG